MRYVCDVDCWLSVEFDSMSSNWMDMLKPLRSVSRSSSARRVGETRGHLHPGQQKLREHVRGALRKWQTKLRK